MVMQLLVLLVLLLSLRYTPATPPKIPQLFMHRLSKAKPRSFSDMGSCLLLFVPFVATVSLSNLAIAVVSPFRKILPVSIYVTYSTNLRMKATNGASLGAHVAWAEPPQRIIVILAVAVV